MREFNKGDRIRYVPSHARGDYTHPDCEDGVVSSVRDNGVFVKYDNSFKVMLTGDEDFTSQMTGYQNVLLWREMFEHANKAYVAGLFLKMVKYKEKSL